MKKVVAIYHKDCPDGTTAAAVILKKYPEAKVFPLSHSYTKEDIDPVLKAIDSETEIYTVDCVMGVKEILAKGFKVTSIEHHISVKVEFENLARENSNFTFVFDNNFSGASLTWKYFFLDEKMPELVKYIEDQDLWNWKYKDETKKVARYVGIFMDDPETVLKLMNDKIENIFEKGEILLLHYEQNKNEFLKVEPVKLKIENYTVLAYNIPSEYASECGNILSVQNSQTVVMFNIDGDKVKYSFRGIDAFSPSALDLATILGGGGHRNSSGAATTLKKFLEMIIT